MAKALQAFILSDEYIFVKNISAALQLNLRLHFSLVVNIFVTKKVIKKYETKNFLVILMVGF